MRSPVLTPDEVTALPEDGIWFLGLVRDDTGLRRCEIYPGVGYAYGWRWRDWPAALLSVWHAARAA